MPDWLHGLYIRQRSLRHLYMLGKLPDGHTACQISKLMYAAHCNVIRIASTTAGQGSVRKEVHHSTCMQVSESCAMHAISTILDAAAAENSNAQLRRPERASGAL